MVKNPSAKAGDLGEVGSIPGSGRLPEAGNGSPLQYSGLENSMDYIVHEVTKSGTRLTQRHTHSHMYSHIVTHTHTHTHKHTHWRERERERKRASTHSGGLQRIPFESLAEY